MATPSTSTPHPPHPPATTDDPFDSLLTLEDDFYTQGYNQGLADGELAGRTEGRQLGLERGFQKFAESGRLQGRAIVWANRLRVHQRVSKVSGPKAVESSSPAASSAETGEGDEGRKGGEKEGERVVELPLPPLPHNPRLGKHVSTLYALAETESLSTENTDEAVDDFDDRLRRAQGRAKIIGKMVGEAVERVDEGQKQGQGQDHGHDPGAGSGKGDGEGEGGKDE